MSRKPNKNKQQQTNEATKSGQTPRDPGGISWAILSLIVAPAGFILWFIWREQRPKTAAMCLRGAGLAVLLLMLNLVFSQFAG